jgi:hypothetical protein
MVQHTANLLAALHSTEPVTGLTHNFYRYPARFSPSFVSAAVQQFTEVGDIILDPFMGGGTSIVEAIASGRTAVGIDINPLAVFIARIKTSTLSEFDVYLIRRWVDRLDFSFADGGGQSVSEWDPRAKNIPDDALTILKRARASVEALPMPRQRRFAQCYLLALAQWALDGRSRLPNAWEWQARARTQLDMMLNGLSELVTAAQTYGVRKNHIAGRRRLILGDSTVADRLTGLEVVEGRVRLLLTSPPYPGVHVLYHRWQVRGRRETPAPYWLANLRDGHGASFYTFGSRTPTGLERYYSLQLQSFTALRPCLRDDAYVVQLVSFADPPTQLPRYLETMEKAGYIEVSTDNDLSAPRLWRSVPNRRWYLRVRDAAPPSQEVLLIHRPI